MKIAVTATGSSLDGSVDPRFGRCSYFLLVETDDLAFEAVENANVMLGGGAGIQSAQLMSEKGVKYVLTGNCGPNAHQTLMSVGIEVIVGCSGRVRDVVEQFKLGRLNTIAEPNVASHFGISNPASDMAAPPPRQTSATQSVQPPRTGMGMGMGMGGGGGRGMGRGMGRGTSGATRPPTPMPASTTGSPPSMSKERTLKMLKEQAEAVSKQMQEIQTQIRHFEEETETP